jgi:hypothetical protein
MTSSRRLPTSAMERANKAYIWAKHCQAELAEAIGKYRATDANGWIEIEWAFRRLEAAVLEEAQADSEKSA